MHICEFCNTQFIPRPQVIKPRACNKSKCQRLRQRANEREWHRRNRHLSSTKYHRIRRRQREDKIKKLNKAMIKCFSVGKEFLGLPVNTDILSSILFNSFLELGLRKINKFWMVDILNNFEQLKLDFT